MRTRALALLVAAALLSCTDGDDTAETDTDTDTDTMDTAPEGDAVVTVDGAFYLLVGDTAQLTATTANRPAETYAWSSGDDSVATVDSTGLVSGLSIGPVTITATGESSGESGSLGIVVANEIPNLDDWASSGHADRDAEAFRHWDGDGAIPASCAGCHSTPGFHDRIGHDGTAFNTVENEAPLGTVIECTACHNTTADTLDTVVFPSGVTVTDRGAEARCMTCHQGRSSTDDVDQMIADAAAADDDTVDEDIGFENIHYYAAGATLLAGTVRGGYQYDGNVYDVRFRHVPDYDVCHECHNPHSLELRLDECAVCHTGVSTVEDVYDIRMMASASRDFDGDGNLDEGLYYEIQGLRATLIATIQDYADEQGNTDICYDASSYPYWFQDTDGSGVCESGEATFGNQYGDWTARLARAAYNYQVSLKDPGAFAHNGKYLIQLLYDSITDLNSVASTPVSFDGVRADTGHFDGASEAARHWDENDAVSASCSRCHGGAEGLHFFLQYNVGLEVLEQANGLECVTCHADPPTWTALVDVDEIHFPGDNVVENADDPNNLCMNCHSGRESKATVDARIAANRYGFRNVHYLPAAGTLYGDDAQVGYQFDAAVGDYAGRFSGHLGGDDCVDCHLPVDTEHTFHISDAWSTCAAVCHTGSSGPDDIRGSTHTADYDGDEDTEEGQKGEIDGLAVALYGEIKDYATTTVGTSICYNGDRYPYWFTDETPASLFCEEEDTSSYDAWDPELMRTAFNYQYYRKEPGAYAHNFNYIGQLLYDSIDHLGDPGAYVRPGSE